MRAGYSGRAGAWSERVYRALLLAYPRAFREEYTSEMLLAYRDAFHDAARRGWLGIVCLWGDVLGDLVKATYVEHVHSWAGHAGRDVALAGNGELAMAMQFPLHVAQRTDIGRKREDNEDNLLAIVPEDSRRGEKGALFVVSDGMGGHARGEVASELAVQRISDGYYDDTEHDIPTALRMAIEQANAAIFAEGARLQTENPEGRPMGATCVAAVLHHGTLYAANVGDSRVYVLRDGRLRQVTRDHSLVAQMVERGEITPAEARTHEQRNIIYRSLGVAEVEVDLYTEPTQAGDTVILCTDGLCGVIEDDELREIVTQYGPDESAERLIARANDEGGPDNATVIVVRVGATS